jgi:cytochrome c oxidase subunit II
VNRLLSHTVLACALALAGSALAQDGAEVYAAQCASCHQPEGQGLGTFPALADNEFVQGDERDVVALMLTGREAMPAFGSILDDAEIAAVLTHVRSAWGNDADAIDADLVADVRGGMDEPEAIEVDLPDDWFELGEAAYLQNCAACHQATGAGIPGAFPALAENAFVQGNADALLRLLLDGRAGMPAFGSSLDNAAIALIASYVRNAWQNEAHLVDAAMVEVIRGGGDLELDPTTPTFRPGAGE